MVIWLDAQCLFLLARLFLARDYKPWAFSPLPCTRCLAQDSSRPLLNRWGRSYVGCFDISLTIHFLWQSPSLLTPQVTVTLIATQSTGASPHNPSEDLLPSVAPPLAHAPATAILAPTQPPDINKLQLLQKSLIAGLELMISLPDAVASSL